MAVDTAPFALIAVWLVVLLAAPVGGLAWAALTDDLPRHLREPSVQAAIRLSLATSAQVHLGAIPHPTTGKPEPDLALAKQTIDILGIIEEKTKGNLTEAEGRLLEHVLFDLRMMYVELSK